MLSASLNKTFPSFLPSDWINQQHDDMLMTVRSLKNGDRNQKKKPASIGSRYLEREFHQRRRTPHLPGIIRRIKRVVGDGVQVAMVTMADCKEKLPFVCQSNAMKSTSVSSGMTYSVICRHYLRRE